jgi:hypothetical protein
MTITRTHLTTAVAIAFIIAIAGTVVALTGGSGSPPAAQQRHPTASAPPLVARAPDVAPVVDFSGVRWVPYHGVRLPQSAQAGPSGTAYGCASGYADSPLGALLAMINIGVRTSWELGPAVFQPTIQQQVTGPFEAAMLSADLDAWGAAGDQAPPGDADAVEAAYQWVSYTPSVATADIVTEGTSTSGSLIYAVTQIQAEWLDGDWRVVAPPGGNWANDATQIPSTNGYLTFPGQEG